MIPRQRYQYGGLYCEVSSPVEDIILLGMDDWLTGVCFRGRIVDILNSDRWRHGTNISMETAVQCLREYFHSPERILDYDIRLVVPGENGEETPREGALNLSMAGYTKNEIAVYRVLVQIGIGKTISYSALARKAGLPGAARFAGSAMAKNSFPIFIPCHRVIKADNSLGNYGGGLHIKEYLLQHESAR